MASIKLELKRRNRDYGIITWPYEKDFEMKTFLENKPTVTIEFKGRTYSDRKVDYKYRRMPFGKKKMENFKDNQFIVLTKKNGKVIVSAG